MKVIKNDQNKCFWKFDHILFYKTQMLYHTFWLDHAFPSQLNVFASNFSHFPHFYLGYVVIISVWESWGLLQSTLLPAAL